MSCGQTCGWTHAHHGMMRGWQYVAVLWMCSSVCVAVVPNSEIVALSDLYRSTNGPDWTQSTQWLNGNDPCATQWFGVTCNTNGTHVTQLDLSLNQLSGSIPASVGSLTQLTSLDLCCNRLIGPIPDALGSLTRLTYMDLDTNQLVGPIPDSISSLTRLTDLYLSYNQLMSCPQSIGSLGQLTFLALSANHLSAFPSISNLTQLTSLWLDGNQISGHIPDSLVNLTQLTDLRLNNNKLSGTAPDGLALLVPHMSSTSFGGLELQCNNLTVPSGLTAACSHYSGHCVLQPQRPNTSACSSSVPSMSTPSLRRRVRL